MIRNVKLTIAYEGSSFHGWQIQPNAATVQEILKKSIETITGGEEINLVGAGRTDAGVHALGQVANFKTEKPLTETQWKNALNAMLPPEIAIQRAEFVPDSFHSRYSAKDKTYAYRIGFERSPFLVKREWRLGYPLKLAAMKQALPFLKGKHDFSSFASSSSESASKICHIKKCEIKQSGSSLVITLSADRFLTYMVRNIVGTLVKVGAGKIKPKEIQTILEMKDRSKAGPTAPPDGLYLVKVNFP